MLASNLKKLIFSSAILILSSGCATVDMNISQNVDCDIAAEAGLYAAIASNSYLKPDRVRFPIENIGWYKVDLDGNRIELSQPSYSNKFTGLALDIWENDTSNKAIFAFRGTDSKWDYVMANATFPISIQYKSANKKFQKYRDISTREITVTGHSLGGGLALSISTKNAIEAYVFDSSPRVFDGFAHETKEAKRVLIYQNGEALEEARKLWKIKIDELVPYTDRYLTDYKSELNRHRSDLIALGLVIQGASCSSDLMKIKNSIAADDLSIVEL